MIPEMSRPVPLSKIGPMGTAIMVRATPVECAAIAVRMDIPAIRSLECMLNLTLGEDGFSIVTEGRLRAQLTRVCVISAEEFEVAVEDDFKVCFVPAGAEREDSDPDQVDEIPYESDILDLGEAVTEQLGLALDPYPRMDGASVPNNESSENTSPFTGLWRRLGT